ncbi:MAG: hypothetical protein V7765_04430 [Oleispira sp.]
MPKISIVTHDAGAANHLFSWLKESIDTSSKFKVCAEGPSKKLFFDYFPELTTVSLSECIEFSDTVITGTGWASDLEHQARCLSHQKGKMNIAFVDHWTNYKSRFIRNGIEQMPSEIWVADSYAREMAEKIFHGTTVVEIESFYLKNQIQEIHSLTPNNLQETNKWLFVMEPIRDSWGQTKDLPEIESFRAFMGKLEALNNGVEVELIIKPHPSDPVDKYDFLTQEYTDFNLRVDNKSSLASLIASSKVIIGFQTYAMVVALAAGKKVVGALPGYAPPSLLPHNEIVLLFQFLEDINNEIL